MTGKVLKLSSTLSNISYTLDERTGYYVRSNNTVTDANDQRGLMDFICDPEFVITSVQYPANNGTVFSIGDFIKDGNNRIEIHGFDIRKNVVQVLSEDDNASNDGVISISSARVYVNNADLIREASEFFSQLETRILNDNTRKFKLERILKTRRETPEEFLVKFFKGTGNMEDGWNYSRNTIYIDNSEIQTQMGKRRSLGDIFIIMKYYYPNITLKEVVKLLYVDLFAVMGQDPGLRTSICSQIRKRVWYYEDTQSSIYNVESNDEYGNTIAVYKTQLNNLTLTT